ncbi:MAG: peptidoglycan DD-metalloendopeptidase family protein [Solirubrobacterales bacterium]
MFLGKAPPARGRSRRHTSGIRSRPERGHRVLALAGLTLVALAAVSLTPSFSSGRSLDDKIDAKRRHLERVEGRETHLQGRISSMNEKLGGLRVRIVSLERKESHAKVVLAQRQSELERVTARYERAHRHFVRLRKQLNRAEGVLAERLVAIYKSDAPDMLTVVLESDGFNDLLTRTDYLSKINDSDQDIVTRVKTLKHEAARKRAELVDLKTRAEVAVEAVENQKRTLAATRSELSVQRNELSSVRAEQKDVLGGVREDKHKLEGDLSKLSAQVESQLGGFAGPIRRGSGQMIWPVNGPITSPFCERRSWESCHPGIDIGVGTGTPIRAADSGTVAMAGAMGGYGNYTCINHGGGLSTCYAHQSAIKVSVGQNVSQGQVIGLVGCTGLCFGAHLHFEVRVGGAVTNPLNYL